MKTDEYIFDEKEDVLYARKKKILTADDVMSHYRHLREYRSRYPEDLQIIIDCSQTKFDFRVDEVPRIVASLWEAMPLYASLREAILVSQPYETAIAQLFSRRTGLENYTMRLFYEELVALEWLLRESELVF